MLAHFIPHKGKGLMVFVLPLIIGVILFLIFDGFNINDRYILPITLLLSSFIIWFYDGGPEALRNGFKMTDQKNKHTIIFIPIRYWAIVLGITGCILLGKL